MEPVKLASMWGIANCRLPIGNLLGSVPQQIGNWQWAIGTGYYALLGN